MNTRLANFVLISIGAAVGCADAEDRSPAKVESTQQRVECAGSRDTACPQGQECVVAEATRNETDPPGICVIAKPSGSLCGGIAGLLCPAGEECFIAEAERKIPDATGTCLAKSVETDGGAAPAPAEVCGGFANLPCPSGKTCVIADADKNMPDATGTCR